MMNTRANILVPFFMFMSTALTFPGEASARAAPSMAKRATPPEGFFPPASWLAAFPANASLGEPLNVIISGHSDQEILGDAGLRTYLGSFNFGDECLGLHIGEKQRADLGDGNGLKDELAVFRYNFGDPKLGTCKQSLVGGNHGRAWRQNGPNANSGAIFFATSVEFDLTRNHDIVQDGYNLGRNEIVGNITHSPINSIGMQPPQEFTGTTTFAGFTYETKIRYISTGQTPEQLIRGINHADTVAVGGRPPVDGLVAVLTPKIVKRPTGGSLGLRPSLGFSLGFSLVFFVAYLAHL